MINVGVIYRNNVDREVEKIVIPFDGPNWKGVEEMFLSVGCHPLMITTPEFVDAFYIKLGGKVK